ncbi:MAG: DUF2214 domain-containing protein [Rhizobiaceae bacterium]|nr:DUF2214 domain-containing protein [Rhizobiaceae bacterium]
MLDEALRALAASPPAQALKASRLAYPLVNALHILGLSTLFGAILALNTRLLGLGGSIEIAPLAAFLPKVAAFGLGVAAVTGLALFSVQPVDYAGNAAFLVKIGLVSAATLHAIAVHRTAGWKSVRGPLGIVTPQLRASAALSTGLWISAIVAGRFIGFE